MREGGEGGREVREGGEGGREVREGGREGGRRGVERKKTRDQRREEVKATTPGSDSTQTNQPMWPAWVRGRSSDELCSLRTPIQEDGT